MLYFPQMLLSTHQHLSFTRWFCSKKHRGVLSVLYSAFSKFVGRNLAFPEHLSPSPRIPKDFRELQTVTPGAALVGQDKTARLAVHGVQNAGTTAGLGEAAQSNQTAFHGSRDCLPSTFQRALREPSRALCFCSLPYPRHFLRFHCASSAHSRVTPYPYGSPPRHLRPQQQPLHGRSPFPSCSRSPPGAGAGAGAARPLRSHAPAGPRGTARNGHRETTAGD